MRHVPRGELIRRRLAADPITLLKARRLRRAGLLRLETLGALMAWLRSRNRLRSRGRRPPLLRRWAASVNEYFRRSQRLHCVCRRRRGWPRPTVRVRWTVADVGRPYHRDDVIPPPRGPRISVIRRVRQRSLLAR